MINLIPIEHVPDHLTILYELLKERTPEQSISHRKMPTFEEHTAFVRSQPYLAWHLIQNAEGEYVGSVYLSKQREVGIFIFAKHARKGYGMAAVQAILKQWGRCLANVNPNNVASIEMFKKLGARHIQNTYEVGNV